MNVITSVFRKIITRILRRVFSFFPLRNYIVFESNPDFNDEGFWLCHKMIVEGVDKKYKIIWMMKSRVYTYKPASWNVGYIYEKPINVLEDIKKEYVLSTAKFIFDSCTFINKRRKKQFRIFLFHAMPLKDVSNYMRNVGNFDYISIGSSYYREYYSKIGFNKDKMLAFGLCRNDQLIVSNNDIHKLLYGKKYNKLILWMPTYRQHATFSKACNIPLSDNNHTGLPVLYTDQDLIEINKILQLFDICLVIKPHQSQDLSKINVSELSNIVFITTELLEEMQIQLYNIISGTDALITDYSSIYVDYLLLNRPIGITIDDYETYNANVGFVMKDFNAEVDGFKIESKEQFEAFIRGVHDGTIDIASIFRNKQRFHDITDFKSAERFYSFIKKYL